MISLTEMRRVLQDDATSDETLTRLRDSLYTLGHAQIQIKTLDMKKSPPYLQLTVPAVAAETSFTK